MLSQNNIKISACAAYTLCNHRNYKTNILIECIYVVKIYVQAYEQKQLKILKLYAVVKAKSGESKENTRKVLS